MDIRDPSGYIMFKGEVISSIVCSGCGIELVECNGRLYGIQGTYYFTTEEVEKGVTKKSKKYTDVRYDMIIFRGLVFVFVPTYITIVAKWFNTSDNIAFALGAGAAIFTAAYIFHNYLKKSEDDNKEEK